MLTKKAEMTINITNNNQECSPFPSGDNKAAVNRRCLTNKSDSV